MEDLDSLYSLSIRIGDLIACETDTVANGLIIVKQNIS